jgi:hypothetical protein
MFLAHYCSDRPRFSKALFSLLQAFLAHAMPLRGLQVFSAFQALGYVPARNLQCGATLPVRARGGSESLVGQLQVG